eukprot:3818080-Pyramimonas_sp.AAC.1
MGVSAGPSRTAQRPLVSGDVYVIGASGAALGPAWGPLGGPQRAPRGTGGPLWGRFGALLEPQEGYITKVVCYIRPRGPPGAALGPARGSLGKPQGAPRGPGGPIWGRLGARLEPQEVYITKGLRYIRPRGPPGAASGSAWG